MLDPELIILDEVAATSEVQIVESKAIELEFPCVLVKNLLVENDLDFLGSLDNSEANLVPLWVEVDNVREKLGMISLTLYNVTMLNYLDYESVMYLPDGSPVDLKDVNQLYKFIVP